MRRSLPVLAVVAVLLLAACGGQPTKVGEGGQSAKVDESGQGDGGGDSMDGADFSSSVTTDGDDLTVKYSLRNTGDADLIAFDRGWVKDMNAPTKSELEANRDDVQVIVAGKTVEFGLRIIHPCHGNAQGELPNDDEPTECEGDSSSTERIAATRLKPGKSTSGEYTFDLASVWADFPTAQAQTTIDLDGKKVKFCLGVDRPENPAKDDLYPPEAAETVLCSDPVAAK